MRHPIRVLVVDDSALMREMLVSVLSADRGIEVVAAVADPVAAVARLKRSAVDVITLDVDMPRMDGLTFLEKLMRAFPHPVVMVSSRVGDEATAARALGLGAVAVVAKPNGDQPSGIAEMAGQLIREINRAAGSAPEQRLLSANAGVGRRVTRTSPAHLIALGASTGGTEALRVVLGGLPPDMPGLVVVQHMPARFTRSLAERLDAAAALKVTEAVDGDQVLAGHVLIAPGDLHTEIVSSGSGYRVRVTRGPAVNGHRPSVDVLFNSCARAVGRDALGVILTGMGSDGALGLLAMHEAGAHTIAQDEASSVVFGMPRQAIECGAVDDVVGIDQIASAMIRAARGTNAESLAAPRLRRQRL